jgi:hypothetical protein
MSYKAIYINVNGDITLSTIETERLLNDYELCCPISKYELSIGVKPIDKLKQNERKINTIATDIYKGTIFGSVVIVSDIEEETPLFYEELIQKYV